MSKNKNVLIGILLGIIGVLAIFITLNSMNVIQINTGKENLKESNPNSITSNEVIENDEDIEENNNKSFTSDTNQNSNTIKEDNSSELREYVFRNTYGTDDKSITITAIKVTGLAGFSGAGSHLYYIDKNQTLCHLSLEDLSITKIATGIVDIESDEGGSLFAYYKDSYNKLEENSYVIYQMSK